MKSDSTYNIPNISNNKQEKFLETEVLGCQYCNEKNIICLECGDPVCISCFKEIVSKDFSNIKCKKCAKVISENKKKEILGEIEYDKLEYESMLKYIPNLIQCPQCGEKIAFEKGNVDYNIRNDKNEKLYKEAAEHYAAHRCRCPRCKVDFCSECLNSPYHIGQTCDSFKRFVTSKRCRYDNVVITNKNNGPEDDICANSECVQNYKISCKKN